MTQQGDAVGVGRAETGAVCLLGHEQPFTVIGNLGVSRLGKPLANFVGVLTEGRRWEVVPKCGVAEADRVSNEIDGSVTLAHGDPRFETKFLGQLDTLADGIDRTTRHAHLVECDEEIVCIPFTKLLQQVRSKLFTVLRSIGVDGEARIVSEMFDTEHLAERPELFVVAGRDDEVLVLGGHRFIREE